MASVLVTGSHGRLGSEYYRHVLCDTPHDVKGLDLDSVCSSCPSADVTSFDAIRQTLDTTWLPDGLVCLHGLDAPPNANDSDPWRAWEDMLAVNLTGTMNICRYVGERAIAEGQPLSIVTVASHYGLVAPDQRIYPDGFVKPAGYSVSKAGVIGITRYLATLWAPHGIRVNCLAPGGIEGDQPAAFKAAYSERVPLRRMGQPSDLLGAIDWLLSDASAYVTGQVIQVDGGVTVW